MTITWEYLGKTDRAPGRDTHVLSVFNDGIGYTHAIPDHVWKCPDMLQCKLMSMYDEAVALR